MVDRYTTTRSPATLIEMFLDSTAGEVYNNGRLATVERENDIALVAYGEHILATIDGYDVTIYKNHHGKHSETVTGYVSLLGELLAKTEGREVDVRAVETPDTGIGRVSDSGQYIDNYVGDLIQAGRTFSDVEHDAMKEVNMALRRKMATIFG